MREPCDSCARRQVSYTGYTGPTTECNTTGPIRNAIPGPRFDGRAGARQSALRAARLRLRSSRLRRRRDAPADRVMTRRGAARAAGPRYRRRASVRYGARRVGRAFHPGNCLRFHTTASQLKLSNLSMLTQSSASPHTSLAPPKRSLNYRMRRCCGERHSAALHALQVTASVRVSKAEQQPP